MDKQDQINEDIILTENAAKRVNAILIGEGKKDYALRVSVTGGGCSGMSYNLTFDNKQKELNKTLTGIEKSLNVFKKAL